jgi:hypothetical protein
MKAKIPSAHELLLIFMKNKSTSHLRIHLTFGSYFLGKVEDLMDG